MSDIYTRIRIRREQLGLSQEELAARMGYKSKSSINKIEMGINDIPQSKVLAFARALETTTAYLMGCDDDEDTVNTDPAPDLSDRAARVGLLYDRADARDQKLVDTVLEPYDDGTIPEQTIRPISSPLHAHVKRREEDGFNELTVYEEPTAAGFGNYLSSSPGGKVEQYPDGVVPHGTSYGVPISGDSMEPKYHDGSVAFVQSVPAIESGEVGLFSLNGSSYIKQLVVDRANGRVHLHSLNPAYPDIEVHEGDYLYTFGRVLGSYPV